MGRALFLAQFCAGNPCEIERHGLQRLSTTIEVRGGKTIFCEGERSDWVFGLSQGIVRLYKMLPDGRRQIVSFRRPGEFLNMPLIDKHAFSADAVNDVSLCRFPARELRQLIRSSPNIMQQLLEFSASDLDTMQHQLTLLGTASAEEKVLTFLVNWRDRLVHPNGLSQNLQLPMGRQDIADFLGMKIETVSRAFAKLVQKHVIRLDHPKGVFLTGWEPADQRSTNLRQ